MTLLVLGLALWWATHVFKRLMPSARAAMAAKMGAGPSKGIVALLVLASVVLMVLGYRAAGYSAVYTPPGWGIHLNNLLMLVAVALFGAGSSKGKARSLFRHPMLMGMITWAFSHLLVNGDLASLVLFGGLGIWAIFAIVLINAREPAWVRPEPGPIAGDIKLAVISLVLFCVIAFVHNLLGPWPFPG